MGWTINRAIFYQIGTVERDCPEIDIFQIDRYYNCNVLKQWKSEWRNWLMYRKLQLYFTPEIEVFYMMFERYHTNNRKMYLKQHIKYFNFRSTLYVLIWLVDEMHNPPSWLFQRHPRGPCWQQRGLPRWEKVLNQWRFRLQAALHHLRRGQRRQRQEHHAQVLLQQDRWVEIIQMDFKP